MNKTPTWIVILGTATLLFGGLAIFSLFSEPANDNSLNEVSEAPLALFFGVAIPIYVIEALCFTVICIELSVKFAKSAFLGAVLGILAYGVLYHWSNGVFSILVSTWIALVLNASYIILRKRSRKIAIISTIAHKLAFLFFAAYSIFM